MGDAPLGRRASTRIDVDLPATIAIGGIELDCTIANLSLGGAQIVSAANIAMHDRVRLAFVLSPLGETIDAAATVRWRANGQVGLQFDGLRAREVWALNQYFKGVQKEAS